MPIESAATHSPVTYADDALDVQRRRATPQRGTLADRLLAMLETMFERSRSAGIFGRQTGPHGLAHLALGDLVEWGDHLSAGNPIVDAQHAAIFGLALNVHALWRTLAAVSELKPAVEQLYGALETHFNYEEAMFAETGYSKLHACRREHRMTLRELDAIRRQMGKLRPSSPVSLGWNVAGFVLGVTVGHVMRDIEYYHGSRN
jgi:hemerythrin-like metal-binding protein